MALEIGVSEARAILPTLVQRVLDGEEITLTRHGEPVAVIVRPSSLRHRRATETIDRAAALRVRLDEAASRPLPVKGISRQQAEARVRGLRSDRGSR